MGVPSTYIHSNKEHAGNLSVSTKVINGIKGKGQDSGTYYTKATIKKLENIKKELEKAEDAFLEGYSEDKAQNIANSEGDLLVQLANEVLYGQDAYEMASALTQNKRVNTKALRQTLSSNITDPFVQELLSVLKDDMGTGELATALVKTLGKKQAVIEVTTAGSHIRQLGTLLDVNQINASFRKNNDVINIMTDKIFKTSKDLTTKKTGVYRNMIKELLETSRYTTYQQFGQSIDIFCKKLNTKMKQLAPKYVHFIYGDNIKELEGRIDRFTFELKPVLKEVLANKKNKEMYNKSNVIGAIGEEVRSAISRTANSVMISFVMGDVSDEEGVNRVNEALKNKGITNTISKMNSYHDDIKQSLSDLVLLNTNNKRIARAQSKDHFVSYFTKDRSDTNDTVISNFRWMVADNLNLLNFLNNLSKSELGLSLNTFDLSNIMSAMAQNLWFQYHDSAFPEAGKISFEDANVEEFQTELEGSFEKLLAGQITNLLGITVAPSGINIVPNASNIFYLLNGRLKRTSLLVQQAIDQLQSIDNLKLAKNTERMVIVNFDDSEAKSISPGSGSNSFLVHKLKAYDAAGGKHNSEEVIGIGEEMGIKIVDAIKIKVSLGTSIDILSKTSLTF